MSAEVKQRIKVKPGTAADIKRNLGITKCTNRGSRHIDRARQMGQRVKLGEQTCPYCGSRINIEKRGEWAFTPPHSSSS